jgi:hypothetical protein
VQEIVLATNAVIICGGLQVDWDDFKNSSNMIGSLGLLKSPERVLNTDNWNEGMTAFMHKWHRVINIGKLKKSDLAEYRSLAICLENLLSHGVTNPLGRVYGMLGMIQPQSKYTKDHPIQVDYKKKTVYEMYQHACEWSIEDEGCC